MADYISRKKAIEAIMDLPNCPNGYSDTYDKECIIGTLEEVQTADVVEVVRCEKCKWYKEGYDIDGKWFTHCNNIRTYGPTAPYWFCADGDRGEDD